MIITLVEAVLFGLWAFAQYRDARMSEQGFAAGYTEGNELAETLFGKRPRLWQLQLVNAMWLVLCIWPAYWMPAWGLGVLVAAPLKHFMSVRKWRKVFATKGTYLYAPRSAWQKFLGL